MTLFLGSLRHAARIVLPPSADFGGPRFAPRDSEIGMSTLLPALVAVISPGAIFSTPQPATTPITAPVPATWAMLAAAMALIGVAATRRRKGT